MKKYGSLLLALLLMLSMAACSAPSEPEVSPAVSPEVSAEPETSPEASVEPQGPVAEEVQGVTIPEFAIKVNGADVNRDSLLEYPVYSVQATSVNSAGTESTTTYVGFAVKDVLAVAGLTETFTQMVATADDGYEITLTGDVIYEGTTLLAMTKDGSAFADAPWLAPCTDAVTGNYLKSVASLTLSGGGAAAPAVSGGSADVQLPEILDRTDKVEFTDFSFKVNDKDITNETLKDCSIYKITATTVRNDAQTTADYTGYKLADVLNAAGIDNAAKVTVIASDGYTSELTGDLITSDYTLVAIEKDKELGENGAVWVAPCSETVSRSYGSDVIEIKAE